MALKKYFPDIRFGGNKVDPDELNMRYDYTVLYPSVSASGFGTCNLTGNGGTSVVFTNITADYPRNFLFTMTGVAGGQGGSITVTGKNQFGVTQTESVGFATANAGGTAAGTKIFSEITVGTVTGAGLGGTAVGTTSLGYAAGTASGIANLFGLPVRIGATGDVKGITWVNNGTVTSLNGGTIASFIGTANHTFMGTQITVATDIYNVSILSSYNSETVANVA